MGKPPESAWSRWVQQTNQAQMLRAMRQPSRGWLSDMPTAGRHRDRMQREMEVRTRHGDASAREWLGKLAAVIELETGKSVAPQVPDIPAARWRSAVSTSLDLIDAEDRRRAAAGQPRMTPIKAVEWLQCTHPNAVCPAPTSVSRRRNR